MVHDRADVARLTGADGVHLPGNGLPTASVRELLGPSGLVGRSVHTAAEAGRAVADGADYVFLGNVWPTATHPDRAPLGAAALRDVPAGKAVAIGGVTAANAPVAAGAGAAGVAAIRALWDAADPAAAAHALRVCFSR